MNAQDLYHRVAFEPPSEQADGYGGIETGWDTGSAVQARAHFRYLRGGESVQAARLDGRQPVVATTWNNAAMRAVTAGWRMRDVNTGKVFNVRTDPVPTDDRRWLEVTVESGVAV